MADSHITFFMRRAMLRLIFYRTNKSGLVISSFTYLKSPNHVNMNVCEMCMVGNKIRVLCQAGMEKIMKGIFYENLYGSN